MRIGDPGGASLARIAHVWFGLGIQSFGGGVATLALIRRAAVEQERWITDLEFTQFWALCQIAPGINLLALTILIGRRTGGAAGVMAALAGLLLPSVSITILMTAIYARIQHANSVRAALRGVLPATIGLGMVAAFQMLRPMAIIARKEGTVSTLVSLTVLIGSGAAVALWHVPVVAVLIGSGVVCAIHAWAVSLTARPKADT